MDRRNLTRTGLVVALAAMSALSLGGCVVRVRPAYAGPVVTVAPPPPRVEVVGVAPAPGYFWVPGYWEWVGGEHVWRPGHWQPGRAGYRWLPAHWVQGPNGGWYMVAGHWER